MKHDEHVWPLTMQLLGKVIQDHRQRLGFNQMRMARELGCSRAMLAMIETAKRQPGREMIARLEKLTGQSVEVMVQQTYLSVHS